MAVHGVNAGGRALARAGYQPVRLDAGDVIAAARRATGLDDFGGEEFREPLRRVVDGCEREARLTAIGRIAARSDIVSLLANRLRLVEDRKRHPAIAGEAIRRPLFILGLPRTGSTLLHHLLARDPRARVAQAWEVMFPSPPPSARSYADDPRIARSERQLRWFGALAPEFKVIHPLGARLALECIAITAPTFLSPRFHTTYRLPSYQAWLETQDLGPAYAFHRQVLQHLQWQSPAGWWVLKAPSHLHSLDALFETYPDARIVQTHRDPAAVLGSVASLTAVLHGAFASRIDRAEIGREVSHRWAAGLERGVEFRGRNPHLGARFLDVHYRELQRDPLAVVRRVYEHAESDDDRRGRGAHVPASRRSRPRAPRPAPLCARDLLPRSGPPRRAVRGVPGALRDRARGEGPGWLISDRGGRERRARYGSAWASWRRSSWASRDLLAPRTVTGCDTTSGCEPRTPTRSPACTTIGAFPSG